MRVLLGLGAAELLEPGARDDLGEDVRVRLLREGDGQAELAVVRRHAGVAAVEGGAAAGAGERVEVGDGQGARQLARAVGAEVEVEAPRRPACTPS